MDGNEIDAAAKSAWRHFVETAERSGRRFSIPAEIRTAGEEVRSEVIHIGKLDYAVADLDEFFNGRVG